MWGWRCALPGWPRAGGARLTTRPREGRRASWFPTGGVVMPTAMPVETDWVKSVLFDRGYLARIRGDAIKVYLVMIESSGGRPDRSVTVSLNQLMRRTRLSCPTV